MRRHGDYLQDVATSRKVVARRIAAMQPTALRIAAAKAALMQYPDDLMVAYPVSKRVNSPKNNDERLITPIRVAEA